MAATYTITVSDAEQKALEYVFYSPQEWISQVVHDRANQSMVDIVSSQLHIAQVSGIMLTGTSEEIMLNADIRSVAERRESINVAACNTIELA